MNDPHVVALLYTIEHGRSVDYHKAKPLDHEEDGFRVKITNKQVRFEFKEPYATEDAARIAAARKAIEDYVRAWEFSACLESGPDSFKLKFHCPEIVDQHPTPGVWLVNAHPVRFEFKLSEPTVTHVVSPACYPSPPSPRLKLTRDVQKMYKRYMEYLRVKDKLTNMAYFCWTVAEDNLKTKENFSEKVCSAIGCLCTNKGGQDARKKEGKDEDLTPQESRFLKEAIKAVIRRTAERAHDSKRDLPKICLSDLPPLKSSQQNFR